MGRRRKLNTVNPTSADLPQFEDELRWIEGKIQKAKNTLDYWRKGSTGTCRSNQKWSEECLVGLSEKKARLELFILMLKGEKASDEITMLLDMAETEALAGNSTTAGSLMEEARDRIREAWDIVVGGT